MAEKQKPKQTPKERIVELEKEVVNHQMTVQKCQQIIQQNTAEAIAKNGAIVELKKL